MPTDPTSIPAEAVEAVVAAAVAGATQSIREMTGNPTLIPSPIGLESIRQKVTAALLAVTPILRAAGRTAPDVLAENERLRVDLAHWMSGRRTRGIPPPATVPDGLTYAAQLVRAQGTEGGEDHDRLLREASMRLKALHDLASRQQDELVWLRQDRDAALAAGRTAAADDVPGYAHEFTITFDGDTYWVECDWCSTPVKSVDAGDSIEETVTKARDHWRTCRAARIAENGADR